MQQLISQLSKKENFQTDSIYLKTTNELILHFVSNQADSALKMAQINERMAANANFPSIQAEAIRHQGYAQITKGNYSEASILFIKALEIYKSIRNENGEAKVYNNLAVVYKNIGDYSKSLEYHFKSLSIKQRLKDKRGIAVSLGNIAILYKNQKKFRESLIEQLKSYRIFKELNDKVGICTASGNLAANYTFFKNYSKAIYYHEEGLKLAQELDDYTGIAFNLDNISTIKFNQKKFKEAIDLQLKALKIREENKDPYGIARSYISLGDFYKNLKNEQIAFDYYSKGLMIANKIGRKELISAFHQEIYNYYKKKGDLNQAIYHLEMHNIYEDSLINMEVESKVIEMKTRYEFEQKAIQLKEEKEKERLNYITKSENQRYIIIIISLFIVFLLAFSISLHVSKIKVQSSYKKLEEANLEIQQKTDALRQSLIEVSHQKNEINDLNFTLQEKVKERTENLEKAYQRLRDFSFANSHQLRKPVANILGLCDLIKNNQANDPENIKIIAMLNESAIELDQIIHQLNTADQNKYS
ncbi:MAG: tetratricopeptide repeat protein [Bacteroidia bacterium]